MKPVVLILAVALSGCAAVHNTIDNARGGAPEHVGPSTSPAPNVSWTPPANAVPPDIAPTNVTMPAGVAPGGAVTLAQVIDVALSNNPTTRTAWLQARAAEAALGSSRSAYLPEIDLDASLTRSNALLAGGGTSDAQTVIGPGLSLNYLLFDFGGRDALVQEARQTLVAADYLHNQSIQDVILRAEQAYYDYLDAKALLGAQDATIKERKTEVASTEARHDAGVATIADVLQARTALSQAQLNFETIEGNLHTVEGQLSTVMGLSPETTFDLGNLPLDVPATEVTQRVDEMLTRAAATRPDLAAQRAYAERARAHIREVRSAYLPSITLGTSVGASLSGSLAGKIGVPYSIGVGLRFPLFTGGRGTYDVRQAEAEASIATENVRSLQQQIALQVWTSYYALKTATQRLTTSRDLLASAEQSVDVASNRYKAGVGNILDLLTAESALENARAQEVQARADWFTAVAQLAHDSGTLEPVK